MTKKTISILICIFVLVFTVLPTGFCFAKDSTENSVYDFESLVEQMSVIYEDFVNGKCDLVTPQYYGLINKCDALFANNALDSSISGASIDRYLKLRSRYFIQKAIAEIELSVHDSTYSVEISDTKFFFYPEQWDAVETVVSDTLSALNSSDENTDIDAIIDDYVTSLSGLPDKPSVDASRNEMVSQSIKTIDFLIIDNINNYLIKASLPQIDKANYTNYRIDADNNDYDVWFINTVTVGYSSDNIAKLMLVHQSALDRIVSLSVFADKAEYDLIVSDTLVAINEIEVNSVDIDKYRLESIKESTIMSLTSFFNSEGYKVAGDKIKTKYDSIINDALTKIEASNDADEVQSILFETQNTLADVDTGNDGSELMTVGIVLFICAVVVAAVFVLVKERNRRERDLKAERRNELERVEQQIEKGIKTEENENGEC